MNELTKRKLNPTETIIANIHKIKEAFIIFYGESERERINDKFNNLLVVGYIPPENIKSLINRMNKDKSKELINDFIKNISNNNNQNINKIFFDDYEIEYENLHPIYKYAKYKNEKSPYLKKDVIKFLQNFNENVTEENIDELIDNNSFQTIEKLLPLYTKTLELYKKHIEEINPYITYVNKCKELSDMLEKKYTNKLLNELHDLFTEEEYKYIKERLNDKYILSIQNINGKTKNYFGYSLSNIPLIESFSQENDDLILNGNQYKIESIKKSRIQYFKNLGLDLGEDYSSYLEYQDIGKYVPTKQKVERITSTIQKLYKEKVNEYYLSLPEYIKNREKIDSYNLLDKQDGYNAQTYETLGTGVSSNLIFKNGKYISFPMLIFGINYMDEYFDHRLVHEFNHLYELDLINVIKDDYYMITGWDEGTGKINNKNLESDNLSEPREKREYELFNEIINELISQEISQIMTDMSLFIFNNKDDKKIKHGTQYERTAFIVQEFYQKYKKEILESRKNNNISIIYNTVGKENFNELNQLFHEFNYNFSQLNKYYKMLEDLKNGIDSEESKIFRKIVEKRDKILEKMQEYKTRNINKSF